MSDQVVADNGMAIDTGQAPVAQKPAEVSTAPSTDWERAYKGLQTTHQKLIRSHQELQATHDAMNAAHQEAVQQLEALKAQSQKLQSEATRDATALSRTRLILTEYPDLAEFETQGLLPQGEKEEELRARFAAFRTTMNTRVEKAKSTQERILDQGASPAAATGASAPEPGMDEDYIWAKMSEFSSKGDMAEFNRWQAQWDKLKSRS
jgi:hypothetical protein